MTQDYKKLLGMKVTKDVKKGSPMSWDLIKIREDIGNLS